MNTRTAIIEKKDWNLPPVELYEKLEPYGVGFMLDSAGPELEPTAISLIGVDPFLIFSSRGDTIELKEGDTINRTKGNPFDLLENYISKYNINEPVDVSIPLGGAVGYLGYNLGTYSEGTTMMGKDLHSIPDSYIGFYDLIIVYNHASEEYHVVSTGLPEIDREAAFKKAVERINQLEGWLRSETKPPKTLDNEREKCEFNASFTKSEYVDAVLKIKEYIASGDIYQANLSQSFEAETSVPRFGLYKKLREHNPAPFSAYLDCGDFSVLSTSPERFLRINGSDVETRPIKGTRARGINMKDDEKNKRELLESEKDHAELLMIIDLERNDLGRVCLYNSIHVPETARLKSYATVHHLVAKVCGILAPGNSHVDCIRLCFPGGSITGAPKIRSMEIIDELEPNKRGIYTGAIGYIGFNHQTDLNIAIRTMVVTNSKIYFHSGAGIVADSEPLHEYEETIAKVKSFFDVLS